MNRYLLVAALLLPCSSHASLSSSTPPNILILLADDLGVDMLEPYGLGADLPATPTINSLANDGLLFRNAWSNPVCSATRATIMTGRYGFRTGLGYVVNPSFGLSPQEFSLPEVLDLFNTGYSHAAFGKWHLTNDAAGGGFGPNLAGFSHYAGSLSNVSPPFSSYFNWPQVENGAFSSGAGYLTSRTSSDAAHWIRTTPEPWLCYVAFHAVHAPFHTPPANLFTVDLSNAGPVSTDPRPHFKAMVEAMDTEIGNLLTVVQEFSPNTTIIFLGDNGTPTAVTVPPFLPSHAKATVFQGGVQVPLIIAGAGVAKSGVQSTALVSTVDIFSTALELAGVKSLLPHAGTGVVPGPAIGITDDVAGYQPGLPVKIDGVSLVPYMRTSSLPSIRQYVFAELFRPNGFGTTPVDLRRTIRNKRYKYIFSDPAVQTPESAGETEGGAGTGLEQLYDLLEDPFELNDLIRNPAGLTVQQKLALETLQQEMLKILNS